MSHTRELPIVVGLGELLWDCFENSRRPGGAPANVAFHADQLGCEGIVCSRVGRDDLGEELVEFLSRQGLRTDFVQVDDQAETGRVTVDTATPGSPQYIIHENVAWDALAFDANTESLMHRADAVCFGTLAQRAVRSQETIQQCLQAAEPACLKVFDVNLRQNWYDRATIEHSLSQADCVKLNHDEVHVLCELFGFLPDNFVSACRDRFDIPLICITRAARGCALHTVAESVDVPGTDVEVVDAVGAGDAFTAALIFARLHDWPLESSARFANAVGGLVTTRPGAMPPLQTAFEDLKHQFGPEATS